MAFVLFASVCLAFNSFANDADLFTYDESVVNSELSDLQVLENYVVANPGVTLTDLKNENNSLIANLEFAVNDMGGFLFNGMEPPLGVSSFLWGCVFGIAGVAVVYFIADDKDETKKAFKGCVINGIFYVIFYVIYAVALAASSTTTTP